MASSTRVMRIYLSWLFCAMVVLPTDAAAQAAADAPQLPPGEGQALVNTACTGCHDLRPIVIRRDGLASWTKKVDNMVVRGAQLNTDEAAIVSQYLARSFGPGSGMMVTTGKLPPGAVGAGGSSADLTLPPGTGRELVAQRCAGMCHDAGRVLSTRRTAAEWEQLTRTMSARAGLTDPAQLKVIAAYLAAHFSK